MRHQVAIVGAGLVGLVLAHLLAKDGIRVQVIEQQAPDLDFDPEQALRVSALNPSSCRLLQQLGVWQNMRAECVAPFSKIEAWTDTNSGTLHFDAADKGLRYLAYVVMNQELQRVLWQAAEQQSLIELTLGTLDDVKGKPQLLVGADGAHSAVRERAGIALHERAYGQQAIVAKLQTADPHQATAYQNFLKTGPLGVLPLHDAHEVSIVWSSDDAYAHTLMALPKSRFQITLANALNLRLGQMTLHSERRAFPLVMRHANTYVKPGVALVGDAAHTIHPLAGQGVNLGFKDAVALSEQLVLAKQRGIDLGCLSVLRKYERARRAENNLLLTTMQLFRDTGYRLGWGFRSLERCGVLKKWFLRD